MVQLHSYTLPELVDLALVVPEPGHVNLNLLHAVLQTIIAEVGLQGVRPWVHIANPQLAKSALTRAKMLLQYDSDDDLEMDAQQPGEPESSDGETSQDKSEEEKGNEADLKSKTEEGEQLDEVKSEQKEGKNKEEKIEQKLEEIKSKEEELGKKEEELEEKEDELEGKEEKLEGKEEKLEGKAEEAKSKEKELERKAEEVKSKEEELEGKAEEVKSKEKELEGKAEEVEIKEKELEIKAEEVKSKEEELEGKAEEGKEEEVAEKSEELKLSKDETEKETKTLEKEDKTEVKKKKSPTWDEIAKDREAQKKEQSRPAEEPQEDWGAVARKGGIRHLKEMMKEKEKSRPFARRIAAAEEGVERLGEIVDLIVDKIKKSSQKKPPGGGPSADDFEDLLARFEAMEEMNAVMSTDHDRLEDAIRMLEQMAEDFKAIKAVGSELEAIKKDLARKANLDEMLAALALKGDLTLVNSKVDQLEFETAIEELGEAIGLLGLKFQTKNDEWEERAAALWRGVDSKMSREVFDVAQERTESRLTALMAALQRMQKVVNEALYPDAGGVTRCITCRRPAVISGHHCEDGMPSPKRPHKTSSSETSSDDSTSKSFKGTKEEASKRQKIHGSDDEPKKTMSVPYRGSINQSAIDAADVETTSDHSTLTHTSSMKGDDFEEMYHHSPKDIAFTNKILSTIARAEDARKKQGELRDEKKDPKSGIDGKKNPALFSGTDEYGNPVKVSTSNEPAGVNMVGDAVEHLKTFRPVKFLEDPLRRESLLSPSPSEEMNLTLEPLNPEHDKCPISKKNKKKMSGSKKRPT